MSDDELPKCDKCSNDSNPDTMENLTVDGNSFSICQGCARYLSDSIEFADPKDRYTEEQHEKALSLLSQQEEINCVISDYDSLEIIIHTDYVTSRVIADFCDNFGYQIVMFNILWEEESPWPCVDDHGSTFEILLVYNEQSPQPTPVSASFERYHIDDLAENDKQF